MGELMKSVTSRACYIQSLPALLELHPSACHGAGTAAQRAGEGKDAEVLVFFCLLAHDASLPRTWEPASWRNPKSHSTAKKDTTLRFYTVISISAILREGLKELFLPAEETLSWRIVLQRKFMRGAQKPC